MWLACLSNSLDRDQLKAILIVTITAKSNTSVTEGTKIVLRISLATTKSSTRSRLLAKPSLTVSEANVRSFVGFLKIFKAEMKAMVIVMPIIMAAIMSIANVR